MFVSRKRRRDDVDVANEHPLVRILSLPAYAPIRQRILQDLFWPSLCNLKYAVPTLIPDAVLCAKREGFIINRHRVLHPSCPSSLRRYVIAQSPACGFDVRCDMYFMEWLFWRGAAYNVLSDFWEYSCPSLAARKAVVKAFFADQLLGMEQAHDGNTYMDMVRFMETHVIANTDAYSLDVVTPAHGIENVVKGLIARAASYESICAFLAAMKRHRGIDARLMVSDLYKPAVRWWTVPLLGELWHAAAANDDDRQSILAFNAWHKAEEASAQGSPPCRTQNILPFLQHMFAVHGPCSIRIFWRMMPCLMRKHEAIVLFLAPLYEQRVRTINDCIYSDAEGFFIANAIVTDGLNPAQDDPVWDIVGCLQNHFAAALVRTKTSPELQDRLAMQSAESLIGQRLRATWNM